MKIKFLNSLVIISHLKMTKNSQLIFNHWLLFIFLIKSFVSFEQKAVTFEVDSFQVGEELPYSVVKSNFKIDTTWSRENYSVFSIKKKYYFDKTNVSTLLLNEDHGVGIRSYLYSFSKNDDIIDFIKIQDGSDNEYLEGLDNDFYYTSNDSLVTIYRTNKIPVRDSIDRKSWTHIEKVDSSYIQLRSDGYFFELSAKYPTNDAPNFEYCSLQLLDYFYLQKLTYDDLLLLKNELYATKGKRFSNKKIASYFNTTSWYTPKFYDVTNKLNSIELKNINRVNYLLDFYKKTR